MTSQTFGPALHLYHSEIVLQIAEKSSKTYYSEPYKNVMESILAKKDWMLFVVEFWNYLYKIVSCKDQ